MDECKPLQVDVCMTLERGAMAMNGLRGAAVFTLASFFALGFIVKLQCPENAIYACWAAIDVAARPDARQGRAMKVTLMRGM